MFSVRCSMFSVDIESKRLNIERCRLWVGNGDHAVAKLSSRTFEWPEFSPEAAGIEF